MKYSDCGYSTSSATDISKVAVGKATYPQIVTAKIQDYIVNLWWIEADIWARPCILKLSILTF